MGITVGCIVRAEEVFHPRLALWCPTLDQRHEPLEFVESAVGICYVLRAARLERTEDDLAGEANLIPEYVIHWSISRQGNDSTPVPRCYRTRRSDRLT